MIIKFYNGNINGSNKTMIKYGSYEGQVIIIMWSLLHFDFKLIFFNLVMSTNISSFQWSLIDSWESQ